MTERRLPGTIAGMNFDKSVMAMPCRGKLQSLAFCWNSNGTLGVEFKVIAEDGRNLSAMACSKLLPWDLYEGSSLRFEIGEMYAVAGCNGLLVRIRRPDTPGDLLLEALYAPRSGQPSIPPKEAVGRIGDRLRELGVIDEADAERFAAELEAS
jgi:hypothetical protein